MVRRLLFCFAFGAVLFSGCNQMPKECRKYSDEKMLEAVAFWFWWSADGYFNCYYHYPDCMDELLKDDEVGFGENCDGMFFIRHRKDFSWVANDTMWVLFYRGDTLNYDCRTLTARELLLDDFLSGPRWFDRDGGVHLIMNDAYERLYDQIKALVKRLGYDDKVLLLGDVLPHGELQPWHVERPACPLFRYDTVNGLSIHPLLQERFSNIDSLYLDGLEEIANVCISLYQADSLWFPACVPVKKRKGVQPDTLY